MSLFAMLLACSGTTAPEVTEEVPPPPGLAAPAPPIPEDAFPTDPVEVAADGSRYDPPVAKVAVPAGAYICDMGFVHYARPDKGDGTCPVCGMTLKKWEGKPAAGADHEDHDH